MLPSIAAGHRGHWRSALAVGLALVVLGSGRLAVAETQVAVLGLVFKGEVPAGVRTTMAEHLISRLLPLRPIAETKVRDALGPRQSCADVDTSCWKALAAKVGCRYVFGGSVTQDDKDFDITLWMGDSSTGQVTRPTAPRRCDICPVDVAARMMGRAAAELAKEVARIELAPAPIAVTTDPPGASVLVDGKEVDRAQLPELKLAAGAHEIVARSEGFAAARRALTVVAGVADKVHLKLVPLPAGQTSTALVVGWTAVGAGIAALGAGIALLVINGQAADCDAGVDGKCQRDTKVGGGVAVGLGGAALGVGAYFLYRGYRKSAAEGDRAAALSSLRFSF